MYLSHFSLFFSSPEIRFEDEKIILIYHIVIFLLEKIKTMIQFGKNSFQLDT